MTEKKEEPFWINNQPIGVYEELPEGYVPVKSIFDFVIFTPRDSMYYELKKGTFILKDNKYVEYEIKNELRDFDITDYIKLKKCYIKTQDV